MGDLQADVSRSDILDGVRFIKNDKILREEDPVPTLMEIDRTAQGTSVVLRRTLGGQP